MAREKNGEFNIIRLVMLVHWQSRPVVSHIDIIMLCNLFDARKTAAIHSLITHLLGMLWLVCSNDNTMVCCKRALII